MLDNLNNELGYDNTSMAFNFQEELQLPGKRVHSINSLLKDQTYNSRPNYHSFKRLARFSSWFFNPWNYNTGGPDVNVNNSSYHDEDNSIILNSIPPTNNFRPSLTKPITKPNKLIDQKNSNTSHQVLGQNYQRQRQGFTDSTLTDLDQNLTRNNNIIRRSFKDLGKEVSISRRIIILKGLPKTSSINGILNRVCGGPLERIVFHDNRETPSVELYFIFPKDAQRFYSYGHTGLFVYNGSRLLFEWANESNTEDISLVHPKILRSLMAQVYHGATRSLLFSKEIPTKVIFQNSNDPGTNYSKDFNITIVKRDFSSLGNVIDISPIISTRLSFCIHFSDIRSSIVAKKQCETKGTKFNEKYKKWNIYYGKDITNKPCLQV